MYLNKVRCVFIILPTIAIVTIYIIASGQGSSKKVSLASVKLPSVVLDGSVGGLGNQLFRYAFAYTLAAQLKTDLYIEVNSTLAKHRTFDSWRRELVLDYFQIPFYNEGEYEQHQHDKAAATHHDPRPVRVEFLPPKSITNIPAHRRFAFTETNYQHKDPVPRDRVLIVEDYWESETFFAPQKWELMNQFQFNPVKISQLLNMERFESYLKLLHDIQSSESVAVHFRIGDFNSKFHNLNHVLPFSFQLRAIKIFSTILAREKKGLQFFVFSDDIEYVKSAVDFSRVFDQRNIRGTNITAKLVFVSPGRSSTGPPNGRRSNRNSLIEFYLMTKCKHFIVPNSTFSWWAAYLSQGQDKIILAACPKNNASYYDKYENLNVRAYKRMLGTNILYTYPRNWFTLNPFEAVHFQ